MDVKKLVQWAQDVINKIEKYVQSYAIPDCVAQIKLLQEKNKAVVNMQKTLEEAHEKVHEAWKEREQRLR